MKQKEYVCGYSDCLHKGEKVPSEIAVKDGTRYFHPDCLKDRRQRNQIFEIYYRCYKSAEEYAMVRKAIKGFCLKSSSEYVLYVLCQSIHKKIPYKGIFTLGWLVNNDMEIRKNYDKMKAKSVMKAMDFENVETVKQQTVEIVHENKKKSWTDTLFG